MVRESFNYDWNIGVHTSFSNMKPVQREAITLPHDAMITKQRIADIATADKKGFFPDGIYDYTKTFFIPEQYKDKRVTFEFEGVYANAMVYINDEFAGQHHYGYSHFYIKADAFLNYGENNEIKVVVKSTDDSRWYTGTGIYRNTSIIVSDQIHFALDGVKIKTTEIESDRALISLELRIENESANRIPVKVISEIYNTEGELVATAQSPVTSFSGETVSVHQRLLIANPKLWSVDRPYLYTCNTKIVTSNGTLDEQTHHIGVRSLSLDSVHGLRINGEEVKLRGACIHHDNGVIGAVAIDRAEERKIEILKKAGFNAIRSSHYPLSKAMLDACDRLGMLVMDESFDVWTVGKTDFDYATDFLSHWEEDIEAMVNKDFNHPSVIIYSIGNEIPEVGTPTGAAWSRKLANKIRELDSTRYIINSINGLLTIMKQLQQRSQNQTSGGNFNNTLGGDSSAMMKMINKSEMVTLATEEAFATVDIAGYNYGDSRYEMDKELFPNRVICGSETFPKDIVNNWKIIKNHTHVIGDFTWTGWDYLGESGIGKTSYEDEEQTGHGLFGAYPWLTANTGDIDITGYRRPISYYREIVFGLRTAPYIAVLRPEHYGKQAKTSGWGWSDSISSWSWDGYEGKPIQVEVYADADEVELLVNDATIGRTAITEAQGYKALFETVYTPGEIIAVAYQQGREIGRYSLKTADQNIQLHIEVDRSTLHNSDKDLSFINISLVDDQGIIKPLADREVTVTVEGAGVLQGFGTGNPKPTAQFLEHTQLTYDGRALVVIRPKEAGTITVTFSAEGCKANVISLFVEEA